MGNKAKMKKINGNFLKREQLELCWGAVQMKNEKNEAKMLNNF